MSSASAFAAGRADVVATIFLARSAKDERLDLPEATWGAVRAGMAERCSGPIVESDGLGFHCLAGGRDAEVAERAGIFLAADGCPRLAAGGDALEAVAASWREDPQGALAALDGSFSLWIVDPERRGFGLVRDRFGSRPLYWVERDGWIFTASECKALAALGIPLSLDPRVLGEVLLSRWIVGDRHVLSPIRQVPAASIVRWEGGRGGVPSRYWTLSFHPESPNGDLARYRDEARTALAASIDRLAAGRRKVGVLLSGGVDSSVIAGATGDAGKECVGFIGHIPGTSNEELDRALLVARHLGIDLRVVAVERPRFGQVLGTMTRRVEEPPRHPNNAVLEQLYARAAEEVDLVLHGDGAEMLFGLADVKRVAQFRRKTTVVRFLPATVKRWLAGALRTGDNGLAHRAARVLSWDALTFAARLDAIHFSPGVERSLRAAVGDGIPEFLPTHWFQEGRDFGDALQAYQAYTFLTSSLVRHDRLAQPFGLISVSPFLEGPVVDVSRRLPRPLRFTDGPKPVLRALCDLYLPDEVSRWSKLGFPVPWTEWLLKAIPEDLGLSEGVARALPGGFLEAAKEAGDAEALWTAASLQALVDAFEVDC